MKLKYYLRGAGVGMIVTAIIMSIAFGQINKNNDNGDTEISTETEDHGETLKSSSETETSETETSETETSETESTETETEISTEEKQDTEADTSIEDGLDTETDASKEDASDTGTDTSAEESTVTESDAEDEENVSVTKSYTISVVGGETSDVVARHLEELGIIESASDFNQYLEANDVDHLLRPGTYDIQAGLDYESIVSILTKR
ncbi:MAG: endolytic transglycosylase MltG [Lachnospiraceae bacterium]|nr:endolytic transglycosylase MltG [Lachnospiraceae bacterium]